MRSAGADCCLSTRNINYPQLSISDSFDVNSDDRKLIATVRFQLLFYSSLLAWFSYKVNANEQGKIIGGTVSVFGLAWAFNALLIGSIAGINIMLPFYIAAFLFVVSAFVIIYVKATSDVKC